MLGGCSDAGMRRSDLLCRSRAALRRIRRNSADLPVAGRTSECSGKRWGSNTEEKAYSLAVT